MRRATTTHPPTAPLQLLTLREVSALLRVEPRYVYRLVNERRIPHLKLGHYLRFDAVEIDDWLRTARRGPGSTTNCT
ncbi:MAG: helix-turn-helix domain-containing protein [Acidimicrobiales bacterium]